MKEHSDNTKRIVKNTMMLYIRMLFSMLVSLYTSRVVLQTLGVEDYGIYNVVGGFVAMFTLITGSLSTAISRFLSVELGKNDKSRLERTFVASLSIHFVLAIILFVLLETIGIWFINNQMTIPINRLYAANWVFQASAFSLLIGVLSVPFSALISSHERMDVYAYISILDTILRLLIVLFLACSPWKFDSLIVYSVLLTIVVVLLQCIYIYYCRKNFSECKLKLTFDRFLLKEIGSFAGWNFIGSSSDILKDQGVNILLNLFEGPIVNAARGISNSVNFAINGLARNFSVAMNPQIIKSYASGDFFYMISLVERGAKFSYYVILLFALPVLLETKFILTLWLGYYPNHTINFVRLILLLSLVDVLSNTLITLQLATGKIRNYQIVIGGMQLLNFPLSYFCLKLGLLPESTMIIAIFISFINLFLRLFFLRKMVGLSIPDYLKHVCFNIVTVSFLSVILPVFIYYNMDDGWVRFIIVTTCSVFSVCTVVLCVGCNKSERSFIFSKMRLLYKNVLNDKYRR